MTATAPATDQRCPVCQCTTFIPETADRVRCERCSWRMRITEDGELKDWLSWMTAGTKQTRR